MGIKLICRHRHVGAIVARRYQMRLANPWPRISTLLGPIIPGGGRTWGTERSRPATQSLRHYATGSRARSRSGYARSGKRSRGTVRRQLGKSEESTRYANASYARSRTNLEGFNRLIKLLFSDFPPSKIAYLNGQWLRICVLSLPFPFSKTFNLFVFGTSTIKRSVLE